MIIQCVIFRRLTTALATQNKSREKSDYEESDIMINVYEYKELKHRTEQAIPRRLKVGAGFLLNLQELAIFPDEIRAG